MATPTPLERLPRPIGLLVTTVKRARDDGIIGKAAEVSFFALLSLPPTLLAVLGGMGYLAKALGPEAVGRIENRVYEFAAIFLTPKTIDQILRPAVESLLREGRADLIGFGVLVTLWSASRATKVLMGAIQTAHGVEDTRHPAKKRLIAIVVTIVGMVAGMLVLPLLVAGPRLGEAIGGSVGPQLAAVWRVLYWPVAALVGIALLSTFYSIALPVRKAWLGHVPGAASAVIVWLIAGAALRFYAMRILQADTAYGSLAAPIVLLLWLHVTSLAVIFGAELNARIENFRELRVARTETAAAGTADA